MRVRSFLEPGRPASTSRFLMRQGPGYALTLTATDVDAGELAVRCARGRALLEQGAVAEARAELAAAVALDRGNPMRTGRTRPGLRPSAAACPSSLSAPARSSPMPTSLSAGLTRLWHRSSCSSAVTRTGRRCGPGSAARCTPPAGRAMRCPRSRGPGPYSSRTSASIPAQSWSSWSARSSRTTRPCSSRACAADRDPVRHGRPPGPARGRVCRRTSRATRPSSTGANSSSPPSPPGWSTTTWSSWRGPAGRESRR